MKEYKGMIVFVVIYSLFVCLPAYLIIGFKTMIIAGLYGLYVGYQNNVSSLVGDYANEYGIDLSNDSVFENFIVHADEESYASQVIDSLKNEYDFKSPVRVVGLAVGEVGAFTAPDRLFSKSNTIYLCDGALEAFSTNNVDMKGIIAHEFGHIYYGHSGTSSAIYSSLYIYKELTEKGISFLNNLFASFRSMQATALFAFILLIPIYTLVFFRFLITSIGAGFYMFLSRRNEYQADLFAANAVGKDEYVKSLMLLNKYCPIELSFKERLFYTHPTWEQRIKYIEKHAKN